VTPAKYARAIFDAIALPINLARVWWRALLTGSSSQ
jgi:hypothetical protein